jgi:hypothetical protein
MTSTDEIKVYPITIGGAAAEALLSEMVENNRPPTYTTVNRYKKHMLAGTWYPTGEPIMRRASDGKVMNGGNRLAAVVAAAKVKPGIQVKMFMAENVPDEAFAVLDTGRARTTRDVMVMATGGKSSGKAAGVVTWAWKYLHGNPLNATGSNTPVPTRTEFLEFYLSDSDRLETSALRGYDCQRRRIAPFAVAGTFHYLLRVTPGVGDDLAENFFGKFISGVGMDTEEHPILQLRNKLIARGFKGRNSTRLLTYTPAEALYLFHRAWKAFATDEDLENLQLGRTVLTNDNFPQIYVPTPNDPIRRNS